MDKGWSWVVMVACFLVIFISGIMVYSVGVINVALLETYREDKAKTAWVGALHSSLQCVAGPLAGALVGQLGCRVGTCVGGLTIMLGCTLSAFVSSIDALLLTYGFIGGVGLSLAYVPAMVAPGYHFDRYRGVASAIAVTGGGLGLFAGGPITRLLLDTYGLRGTFLMLGGISLHMCVLGMVMRPSKLERRLKQLEREAKRRRALLHGNPSCLQRVRDSILDYLTLFKYYAFTCHTVTILLWNVGFASIMLHLPGFSQSLGSSPAEASALYTCIGVGSLMARLLTGPMLSHSARQGSSGTKAKSPEAQLSQDVQREKQISKLDVTDKDDKESAAEVEVEIKIEIEEKGVNPSVSPASGGFDPLTLHFSCLGLCGLLTALLPLYCFSYYSQMTFAVLFGLYSGVPIALLTPLTVELVSIDRLASAFGFETLMMGIGYGLGPPMAGVIIDHGGTYSDSVVFAGGVTLIASMVSFVTCILYAKFKVDSKLTSPEGMEVEVTAVGSLGFLPPPGSLSFLSSTASLHFRYADTGSMLLEGASLRMDNSPFMMRRPRGLTSGSVLLDGGSLKMGNSPFLARNLRSLHSGSGTLCLEKKNGSLGRSDPLLLPGDHLVVTRVEEVTGLSPNRVTALEQHGPGAEAN